MLFLSITVLRFSALDIQFFRGKLAPCTTQTRLCVDIPKLTHVNEDTKFVKCFIWRTLLKFNILLSHKKLFLERVLSHKRGKPSGVIQ